MTDTSLAQWLRAKMDEHQISSERELGRQLGVNHQTVRRLLGSIGQPSENTLQRIRERFGSNLVELRQMAGVAPGDHTPFVLPPEASRLDTEEREVVLKLVWVLLRRHEKS